MKRFLYSLLLSLLICGHAFGANFYWKSSLSELNAIAGVTNSDKAVVMDNNHAVMFYDHTSGAWAAYEYKYYQGSIDTPVAGDNGVFAGPLRFSQTWDNVLLFVQDGTGKLSGSASDNVTLNFSYCSSISAPTCTNVFTSAPIATGAAITYPTLNNSTPLAGDYLRLSIGTVNITNKKLYIQIRYKEQP